LTLDYSQTILQISLLIDAGLVVLIWMVQLIIYPSFTYYKIENLIKWHQKYTTGIAVIVIPLMLSQLIIAVIDVFLNFNWLSAATASIVLFLWVFTFLNFAPLHLKITTGEVTRELLLRLIRLNWIRTFFWSLLFIFHIMIYISF
jgi:hypothetical protein